MESLWAILHRSRRLPAYNTASCYLNLASSTKYKLEVLLYHQREAHLLSYCRSNRDISNNVIIGLKTKFNLGLEFEQVSQKFQSLPRTSQPLYFDKCISMDNPLLILFFILGKIKQASRYPLKERKVSEVDCSSKAKWCNDRNSLAAKHTTTQ